MKRMAVMLMLLTAVTVEAAPRATVQAAKADRASNRAIVPPAATTKAPRIAAQDVDEDGGCWTCYWRYGQVAPLTFEEQIKYDMCRAKWCH